MPDEKDLVARLREQAERPHLEYSGKLMMEAADEIERLRRLTPRVVTVNKSGDLSFSPPSADFTAKSG